MKTKSPTNLTSILLKATIIVLCLAGLTYLMIDSIPVRIGAIIFTLFAVKEYKNENLYTVYHDHDEEND